MDRRKFLGRSLAVCAAAKWRGLGAQVFRASAPGGFAWRGGEILFSFDVAGQALRQRRCLPVGAAGEPSAVGSSGVEVAILCDGQDSSDAGMKQGLGEPGDKLRFSGKREEEFAAGKRLVLSYVDPVTSLQVESVYESRTGVPMVRRWTRVTNAGNEAVGIDYVGSAMLHGLVRAERLDKDLLVHFACNSWMSEGQWQTVRPKQMGLVQNGRLSWSEVSAGSVGTWSSGKYLPMAVVENTADGLAWFWQIEHNGSWYWEVSDQASHDMRVDDVYAYLSGPDDLHAEAWKRLAPGASYETVPVAVGCVRGGLSEAVGQLTAYRRAVRQHAGGREAISCAVIFNDYMNCLWGDPTEAKELPMIAAAARAGCEYYVIDAGWYAELGEDWSPTMGAWEPTASRWPHGLKAVLDKVRAAGLIPGLWLEPEVVGQRSTLAADDDSWFFMRHGKRVMRNARLLLDFRNPKVTAYLDRVIARLVEEYGVGYIKMDYNVNSLQGTDTHADSAGQGLLEHNRAVLAWLDRVLDRYPHLVIENCGSGGGRMDYAMLSRLQIQSMTDQENYRKLPAILVGATAAVLPEQLAVWSYPLATADADEASFNMVTAMACRIHQSGNLDALRPDASAQVSRGIVVYKDTIRQHIPGSVPVYPLGMPDMTDTLSPIALAMRSAGATFLYVWRLEGEAVVRVPMEAASVRVLYPTDLGITVARIAGAIEVRLPRGYMGCVVMCG